MIQRCTNSNCTVYSRYGGRGIEVCKEWRNSFSLFIKDVGLKPSSDLTLERINNDGNYEPGNVEWATRKKQRRNQETQSDRSPYGPGISLTSLGKFFVMFRHREENTGKDLRLRLGAFDTLEEAKAVRKAAELRYWGDNY